MSLVLLSIALILILPSAHLIRLQLVYRLNVTDSFVPVFVLLRILSYNSFELLHSYLPLPIPPLCSLLWLTGDTRTRTIGRYSYSYHREILVLVPSFGEMKSHICSLQPTISSSGTSSRSTSPHRALGWPRPMPRMYSLEGAMSVFGSIPPISRRGIMAVSHFNGPSPVARSRA